jgi:hypothetical protein
MLVVPNAAILTARSDDRANSASVGLIPKDDRRGRDPDVRGEPLHVFGHICYWQIVLKKSFGGDERNFPGPLMRFARRDVREPHRFSETRLRSFVSRYRALQRRSRLKIDICEISGVVRFSTFATLSALFGRCVLRCTMSVRWQPAQPVDATQALNLSAGVSNSKVLRGRSFS